MLVNNAARDDRQDLMTATLEYWDRAIAVNLRHHLFAVQAVVPGMQRKGAGSIINMGSVSWMRGRPGMVGYSTAKAGINGLTRTLARELGPMNIRVNLAVPGAILTERQRALWSSPESNQQFLDLQALNFRRRRRTLPALRFHRAPMKARAAPSDFVVDAGLTQS